MKGQEVSSGVERKMRTTKNVVLDASSFFFFFQAKLTGKADGVKLKIQGGWVEDGGVGVGGVGDRRERRMCTRAISAQKINNSTPCCVRKALNV